MIELHAIIHGRVQLVMFRDFTQRHARRLGISGFVKNLSDGTVEVVGQGEREKLEQLLKDLHGGSLLSRVDTVESELRTPTGKFDDFKIAYEH
jgi:acylphosphatase